MDRLTPNLYVHFPFCRRKCAYCALHSRAGVASSERDDYARRLANEVLELPSGAFDTVYFGGGSPALCELRPLFKALATRLAAGCEFTVELHPLDVTDELLGCLADGGVNRISMGLESTEDGVLAAMGRGYRFADAERAFAAVRRRFDNAGVDLIVGYPGESANPPLFGRLVDWGLAHCSVYSLILEERTILARRIADGRDILPTDDATMDRLAAVARRLESWGLARYEISNYALPGCECRHNLAVWRGEDYLGLGEGAFGRVGLTRTSFDGRATVRDTVDASADERERTLFRLRTREGIDSSRHPEWRPTLDRFVTDGLLVADGIVYRLTPRGTEVCDSILAELV